MARLFTKNISNKITAPVNTYGNLLAGATAMSVHMWFQYNTFTTASNDNRLIDIFDNGTGTSCLMNLESVSSSPFLRVLSRSTATDTSQTLIGNTKLIANTWYSAACVLRFKDKTQELWLNGSMDNVAAASGYASDIYVQGTSTQADAIGSDGTTGVAAYVDGVIGEVSMWRDALAANHLRLLYEGIPPVQVNPCNLLMYVPMNALFANSTELDYVSGTTWTATGTIPRTADPPYNADHLRKRSYFRRGPLSRMMMLLGF